MRDFTSLPPKEEGREASPGVGTWDDSVLLWKKKDGRRARINWEKEKGGSLAGKSSEKSFTIIC